jgi:hypothetical protein
VNRLGRVGSDSAHHAHLEGDIMGFRFRKSIKIFPGLRLNLSKSGVSASIGTRGATVNVSERGTKATVGLPGTGLSYSEQLSKPEQHGSAPAEQPQDENSGSWLLWVLFLLAVGMVLYGVLK